MSQTYLPSDGGEPPLGDSNHRLKSPSLPLPPPPVQFPAPTSCVTMGQFLHLHFTTCKMGLVEPIHGVTVKMKQETMGQCSAQCLTHGKSLVNCHLVS